MRTITKLFYIQFLLYLVSSASYADCKYELFNISSTKNTKIIDFVEQLSDECEYSIIVTDPAAEEILNKRLNKTHIKNLTIDEVFKIVLNENNLSYTLKDNLLKISYLTTKVFSIDYILSTRTSEGSTDVTLSSGSSSGGESSGGAGSSSDSGIKITDTDEVTFWNELDKEFQRVLNRPEDIYQAEEPIINKNAGLVTVTATNKQMQRFEKYLEKLQKRVQLQVLIDVQLISVTMDDARSTGIDWNQLYALQNFSLAANGGVDYSRTGSAASTIERTGAIAVSSSAQINEVIKFLETQGDVTSLSNPKVLTLNNQPALITAGTEYFYKISSSGLASNESGGSLTTSEEEINSVFAGILLSITPEIADDRTITLKINPSISKTTDNVEISADMPPNLDRRQLSSVVTVKDGNKIILGGLIDTSKQIESSGIPILGQLPILNLAFSYEEEVKQLRELVIIIQPYIIDKNQNKLSLSDLGYNGIKDHIIEKK